MRWALSALLHLHDKKLKLNQQQHFRVTVNLQDSSQKHVKQSVSIAFLFTVSGWGYIFVPRYLLSIICKYLKVSLLQKIAEKNAELL